MSSKKKILVGDLQIGGGAGLVALITLILVPNSLL